MNILSRTKEQLIFFKSLLEKDIKDGLITNNYLIHEPKEKFIDHYGINEYLTLNKISHFKTLKDLYFLSKKIITYWNEDMNGLDYRFIKNGFMVKTEKRFFTSELDFNAFSLENNKIHSSIYLSQKKQFVEYFDFNQYQIADLAKKCSFIIYDITSFYPKLKNIEYSNLKPQQMDKNRFILTKEFYNKETLSDNFKFIYTDKSGVKLNCIVEQTTLIKLFELDPLNSETFDFIKIVPLSENVNNDLSYKTSTLISLKNLFIEGYIKGLQYFKDEAKPKFNNLDLNDLERLKKEFDFCYNERKYHIDPTNDKKQSLIKFQKTLQSGFKETDMTNWGFLSALLFELKNYADTSPELKIFLNSEYAIRPETIAKKINAIWVKIKYYNIQKISYDFEIIKQSFLEVKNLFQSLKTNHFNKDEVNELKNEILEALEKIKNDLDTPDQKTFILNLINEFNQSEAKPQPQPLNYNINHFNENSFLLFQYLIDNYIESHKKRQKVKFMNVWFFLNELDDPKYLFCPTKDEYKILIENEYNIEITNTDKPQNYNKKQLPILNNHRQNFESS